MFAALIFPVLLAAQTASPATAQQVVAIAPGVTLIAGGFYPNRGPDGNTVVFDAARGLVVVDTGRHIWHSDAILAYAAARERPVTAIVNTHWHLDHVSGNRRLKAVFPHARIYTSNAVARALSPEGFLGRNDGAANAAMLADPAVPEDTKDDIRGDMEAVANADALRPDRALSRSGRVRIGGRQFDVHITDGAVTDADVWLYDRRTRVAVLGDLVTFPAPLFETACPNAWRRALDEVWATPFEIAIPGHGAPMDRAAFDAYRGAFNGFVDCVQSEAEADACAALWVERAARFIPSETSPERATAYARYYVGYLRDNGGKGQTCLSD